MIIWDKLYYLHTGIEVSSIYWNWMIFLRVEELNNFFTAQDQCEVVSVCVDRPDNTTTK